MKNLLSLLAWTIIVVALTSIHSRAQSTYEPYTFTTLVGSAARFNQPQGVAVDSAGNVYVADSMNFTIRKVTPEGAVTTLAGLADSAGSADGTGSDARFYFPEGVAVDSGGNVYVGDSGNHTIRKVTPAGLVTTLAGLAGSPGSADGTGSAARFGGPIKGGPTGVAVDSTGNVYVADTGNYKIRKVTPAGEVTTLAVRIDNPLGDAPGPKGVAVDSAGNVYVADTGNNTIRKVTPAGVVTTLAGLAASSGSSDGTGSDARFGLPTGVAVDSAGNLYVADRNYNTIRKVTPAGVVTTLAGLAGSIDSVDGMGSDARFNAPQGVAVDSAGNVYVADTRNYMIRKVTPAGEVTTLVGRAGGVGSADGTGTGARFEGPKGVAVDSAGNVYVADTANRSIRKVTPAGGVSTLAGLEGSSGSADGTGSAARFGFPSGVAVDNGGNVYVADFFNDDIRKVTPAGVVTTLAGPAGSSGSVYGTGTGAWFSNPSGVAVDGAGNVYVADSGNHMILKVTPAGVVTTLAGRALSLGSADGTGSDARFFAPSGVAVDSTGSLYVTDSGNHTIRKLTPSGVVTTLAGNASITNDFGGAVGGYADGTGSDARFYFPEGVAVDSAGNAYVADLGNASIRKVTPTGVVTTLAGLPGNFGSADGTGSAARFEGLSGVAVDSAGNVYVADSRNHTIRKGYPALAITSSGRNFGFNGGQFGFNLSGPAGRLVVVETSADLMSWLPLWTNTFTGALNFNDPQSGVHSNRFYRAHLP